MAKYAKDLMLDFETPEMAAWHDFFNAASRESISNSGLQATDLDGAVATRVAHADVLAFNRVIGIGLHGPATDQHVEQLIRFYSEAGVPRFFVQLSPAAHPAHLERRLNERGFQHYNNWVKLYRDTSPPPSAHTDLTVRQIDESGALAFGTIAAQCFGLPEATRSWIGEVVGRPGWQHYLAFDRQQPVATGALFVSGDQAWLDFAATLPEYRGRGAQAALLARRIVDAAQLGCRWLVVETAEETPQRGAPSFRNMLRFGFRQAYVRPNFIYAIGS